VVGHRIECTSAIARLEREGALSGTDAAAAADRLQRASAAWIELVGDEIMREHAIRLLRLHRLRAADAMTASSLRAGRALALHLR
jgi:hypothetical protein